MPTIVSLNTIMVDGTGMCGGCRVTVGGETKFVCVDGPEFDGHQVDFDMLIKRLDAYKRARSAPAMDTLATRRMEQDWEARAPALVPLATSEIQKAKRWPRNAH